ncbi:Predicted ABC-type exoprotein transport system, permease component [Cohnella sp. OV330]|uniref:ABC transporter permease n=1 Tax=Cohnella sp. OV330 TaxID=1855288 RepID=UPI0008E8E082|nr:ABC transporter permease [Cohnella sp. OV330]SFA80479.1 Predicted ABC-type exoprotein transport system, permease component [Cohnella sp. OV330]
MKPKGGRIGRLRGKSGPLRLIFMRSGAFWLKSIRAWRLTLDWTVLLYLVVPGLWVAGGMYQDLLRHPPEWIGRLPAQMPIAILAILMVRGRLRTFAEYGDGLFLRANGRWVKGMTLAGLAYTLAARMAVSAAGAGLMLPLMSRATGWSFGAGAALALSAGLMGFIWTVVRDASERRWQGVRRVLAVYGLRAAFIAAWVPAAAWGMRGEEPVVAAIGIAALIAIGIGLGWRRLNLSGTFAHELETEQRAYADNVGWVLMDTEQAKRPPAGRRPWVLRKPRPLLKRRDEASRIAELWLRAMLREAESMRLLFQFASLGMAAIWLSPLWLGAIAWFGMCALLLLWLNGLWAKWETARYMALYDWREELRGEAREIGRSLLLRPIALAWCAILGLHAGWMYGGPWWLAIAALPAACYPLLSRINRAASSMFAARRAGRARPDAEVLE